MDRENLRWLASKTFSDEHYGVALTEEELNSRLALEGAYKDEIEEASLLIKSTPEFNSLSYEDKLNFAANLIVELNTKKEEAQARRR